VGLGDGVWKKHKMKLVGAPKLRTDGVWCRVCSVLFLVKPSSNTGSQIHDKFMNKVEQPIVVNR